MWFTVIKIGCGQRNGFNGIGNRNIVNVIFFHVSERILHLSSIFIHVIYTPLKLEFLVGKFWCMKYVNAMFRA